LPYRCGWVDNRGRSEFREEKRVDGGESQEGAAAGFEKLGRGGNLYLRPGGEGIRVTRRFLALAAERYYALIREIISRYHPGALILGDRYQSFYYPEVARAAAPHVDAVSTNLNAAWNDGTFARYYLETLHALTGKPILVSEFYAAARENRSGNRNSRGVFPVAATQAERAAAFRTTLESLAKLPYVIGADWFQYYDEPTRGRHDGEDFNFGLVDIHDRPYEEITASSSSIDLAGLRGRRSSARPDASAGIPPAPPDPLGRMEPTLALKHWDRERGFVKPVSEFPLADLYACWDGKTIYLGLLAQDVIDDAFYREKLVPESDRAEWMVSIVGAPKPIRARIGAGLEPMVSDPSVRIAHHCGVKLTTRSIAAMELPAASFGRNRFKGGDAIELASTFLSHCRAYRVEWKGRFILGERG